MVKALTAPFWSGVIALEVIPWIVAVGRVTGGEVTLLGTAFALPVPGLFATALHVTDLDDRNLALIFKPFGVVDGYQDTADASVKVISTVIQAANPLTDLCIMRTRIPGPSPFSIASSDLVHSGDQIYLQGYPHANYGRLVLTNQTTEIGAKILIDCQGTKSKHLVLNIQARPGQSGSPVFIAGTKKIVAVLIGSYAPRVSGGINLGGIDPHTLHQTTHAVSAEYLKEMISQ